MQGLIHSFEAGRYPREMCHKSCVKALDIHRDFGSDCLELTIGV